MIPDQIFWREHEEYDEEHVIRQIRHNCLIAGAGEGRGGVGGGELDILLQFAGIARQRGDNCCAHVHCAPLHFEPHLSFVALWPLVPTDYCLGLNLSGSRLSGHSLDNLNIYSNFHSWILQPSREHLCCWWGLDVLCFSYNRARQGSLCNVYSGARLKFNFSRQKVPAWTERQQEALGSKSTAARPSLLLPSWAETQYWPMRGQGLGSGDQWEAGIVTVPPDSCTHSDQPPLPALRLSLSRPDKT